MKIQEHVLYWAEVVGYWCPLPVVAKGGAGAIALTPLTRAHLILPWADQGKGWIALPNQARD